MRRLNLVSVCAMALFLGTMVASAGCGDDGGDSRRSSSSSSTTSSSSSSSGGGGGQGGAGGQGEGGGSGGQGGAGEECVTCFKALTTSMDPEDPTLCAATKPKLLALQSCICAACGAAAGDACYVTCTTEAATDDACRACGTMAATAADGACKTEGDACIQDTGM
jgi:hypothetical protein